MVDNRSSLKAVLTDWDGATLDLRWDPYKATVMPVLHTGTCMDAEGPPDFESRGASTDYSDASSECGSSSGEDCLDVQQQQQQEEEEEKEKEEVTFSTSSLSPRAAAAPRTATSLQHRPPDALLTRTPAVLDSHPDADAEAASLSGASDTRRGTLSIASPHAAGAQEGLVVGYPTELVVYLAAVRRRRLSGSRYAPSVRAVTGAPPSTHKLFPTRPSACMHMSSLPCTHSMCMVRLLQALYNADIMEDPADVAAVCRMQLESLSTAGEALRGSGPTRRLSGSRGLDVQPISEDALTLALTGVEGSVDQIPRYGLEPGALSQFELRRMVSQGRPERQCGARSAPGHVRATACCQLRVLLFVSSSPLPPPHHRASVLAALCIHPRTHPDVEAHCCSPR
jgi:hypothetical protein